MRLGILITLLSLASLAIAQPSNNDCNNPIQIPAGSSWCSDVAAYSSVGASPSGYGPATCFGSAQNDVWFSFTATGTDITITVIGNQAPAPGGNLSSPQAALYVGNCGGTINQLQCESAAAGANVVELYKGGLIIGQVYLLRVQGISGATGTFQLCVNNYNAPATPGSDCITGAVLCDKSPFVVQSVTSAGNDPDEASSSCLGGLFGNSESNSTWFKWTCDQSGTLTFTLDPNNPSDDLDFVVYELPNGLNGCGSKVEMRCMAAGSWDYPSPCMGPTGLNMASTDFTETAGCDPDPQVKDGFVKYIDMVSGKSYALLVNNFSETGNGFGIEWGGTGTFLGPTADLLPSITQACAGETFSFQDNSSFVNGAITGWTWSFGVDASTPAANTQGPHSLTYSSPGTKAVVLTVLSDLGCIVTDVELITVDSCCDGMNEILYTSTQNDVICRGDNSGAIAVTPTGGGGLPYTFQWTNGTTTSNLTGLDVGNYAVTISNGICEDTASFPVGGPPPWDIPSEITRPTCDGGTDGAITLTNVSGSNGAPYQFNWDNTGFGNNTSYNNLSNGLYDLVVQDVNGCDTSLNFDVHEIILDVNFQASTIIDPSCYGYSDGYIEVEVLNGSSPFTFSWNGLGETGNVLTNLPVGTYILDTIWDDNHCRSWEKDTFQLNQPDTLTVSLDSSMVSCYGDSDGIMSAAVLGGTPSYIYNWSNGAGGPEKTNLAPGNYSITILDSHGCEATGSTTIDEPPQIFIDSLFDRDASCYGYGDGEIEVYASGGRPGTTGYSYALNSNQPIFSPSGLFYRPAGTYTVYAQDSMGCMASQEVTVGEPMALTVDAGPDQHIELGDSIGVYAELGFVDWYDYQWFAGTGNLSAYIECDSCRGTDIIPNHAGTFYVQIFDEHGCTAIDSMNVTMDKVRNVFIPNAFSPNGDGNNDFLLVYSSKGVELVLDYKVFDRWGDMVYHNTEIPLTWSEGGWDGNFKGKEMSPGVYVYLIEVLFIDGHKELYAGDVTLLR